MTESHRPRRSVLYMPGSNPRALEKGRSVAADALILDLEDAVAGDKKPEARNEVVRAIKKGGYGSREIIVRVNPLDTEWGMEDVRTISKTKADAILLPKVETAEQVIALEAMMVGAGAPREMSIMCMMETPMGMLCAKQIAGASKRISCLVMGTSDLVKDLQAQHTGMRLPVLTSLGLCLLAARAYKLAILDGVYLDLKDDEGLLESCRQGRELGFDGKTLIHPKTVDVANKVFGPSEEAIEWAQAVVVAYNAALKDGKGVAILDGKLIENLHAVEAKRILATAEAIRELEAYWGA
ncbi:CoA ester lyase [Kiloniella laminariae]|uniref:CoA ester lyase n=1 Tax=Kiloniella laminariae TaxID=454162 RepID=A0ABT4LMT0_9PROT|nr:CoA ester lyase [Kiloniella laminariae]MCZ4282424.1 CoA ester lyase [Kiloniella laminariae]